MENIKPIMAECMNDPIFSIIIPVYNGEETLSRAIMSCLQQTCRDFEIIVVNNASTDETRKVVDRFQSEKIRYYYLGRKGRSYARNFGIEKSKGKYLQFLDADDEISQQKLERALVKFSEFDHDAIQSSTVYYKDSCAIKAVVPTMKRNLYETLLIVNSIPINSMIIKREICSTFPEDREYLEDRIFWIHSLKNAKVGYDPDFLGARVHLHSNNTSNNYYEMFVNNLLISLEYLSCHLSFKMNLSRQLDVAKKYLYYRYFIKAGLIVEDKQISEKIENFYFREIVRYVSDLKILQRYIANKIKIPEDNS
ncbi:MAG: hypothetical protein CVU90_15240 [Firmicutes bacterium HGW-Firmicutes-15]|nr:MAG: hypothetical protein CVU90_15240 [Firmicutes bacterium HGW-Firmicutes-15]